MKKVISIVGPTSVGKTKLGVELAKEFNTDVISADSIQIYKRLDIGSAKITKEESEGVYHHLIDILEPTKEFSVADFQRVVREKIEKIDVPLLVGGTGLYINAILNKFEFSNNKRNKELEKQYDHLTNEELYEKLIEVDKKAAAILHYNNRRRVYRALEYFLENNESITNNNKKNEKYYDSLIICLNTNREVLYERINKRVDIMFERGLEEEVRGLYNDNIDSQATTAIGYKELYSYFNNEITLEEAKELIKKNSRNFAKRQLTYFKNQFDSKFIDVNINDFDKTIDKVKELVKEFLK